MAGASGVVIPVSETCPRTRTPSEPMTPMARPAGFQSGLDQQDRGSLAQRARDADEPELLCGLAVEGGGQRRQGGPGVGNDQGGNIGVRGDGTEAEGPSPERLPDECGTVGPKSRDRNEQITGANLAGVEGDAGDFGIGAVDRRAEGMGELSEPHAPPLRLSSPHSP